MKNALMFNSNDVHDFVLYLYMDRNQDLEPEVQPQIEEEQGPIEEQRDQEEHEEIEADEDGQPEEIKENNQEHLAELGQMDVEAENVGEGAQNMEVEQEKQQEQGQEQENRQNVEEQEVAPEEEKQNPEHEEEPEHQSAQLQPEHIEAEEEPEQEQEQVQEQEQEQQQEQAPLNAEIKQEQEKQKSLQYIHKLQRKLRESTESSLISHQQKEQLKKKVQDLTKQLEISKQTNMDFRKKKLMVELERTKLMKEVEKLSKQNQTFKKKMEEVQAIGDIFVLKNTLEELNLLSQTQKKEIQKLQELNEQHKVASQMEEELGFLNQFSQKSAESKKLIEQLSEENQQLKDQNILLKADLQEGKKQLEIKNKQIDQYLSETEQLKEVIKEWQKKWGQFQTERETNRKARELQQSINNFMSEKNIENAENQFMQLNVLSDREENKIILREYLILDGKNKELTFTLEQTKNKLKRIEREQLKVKTDYIKKNQYIDLSTKYNKAKKCLEGAFLKLRELQKADQEQSVAQEVNELLQGVQAKQCHNFIKNINQIVEELHQKIQNIESKSLSNDLKLQLVNEQNTISTLKGQLEENQKVMHLMNEDIQLKNRVIKQNNQLISSLRDRLHPDSQESLMLKKINTMEEEIRRLKETISIQETKNILLVKEASGLKGQLNHWKVLYEEIKENLTEKIELSLVSQQSKVQVERMEDQGTLMCKECELRKLNMEISPEVGTQETQTDNLYDCYYKEMKEYLKYLKEVYKEYDHIPTTTKEMVKLIQQIKDKFTSEFKDKYEKMQSIFRGKQEELRKEKNENEEWRKKVRQDIREEFQDVRDLVMNNRLMNALRQAKNLIDYLENEMQKQDEEGMPEEAEEEMVEEKKEE